MTSETLEKHVNDWVEVLWGKIPEEKLSMCFVRAYQKHEPGKIFEACAVLRAWDEEKAAGLTDQYLRQRCSLCQAYDQARNKDPAVKPCPFHPDKNF